MGKGPLVACVELERFDETDIAAVRRAFSAAPPCPLAQAWRPAPEPDFRPASARVGRREKSLLVFAELADDDVHSAATGFNQRLWELGDAFEIFLQAPGAAHYAEFHVAPNNQRLQLRIPIPRPHDLPPERMMVAQKLFDSRAWIGRGWHVLAEIPFESVGGRPTRFSFSRYDRARGRPEAVLSSTSPHAAADFHRREEWGTLAYP
ncbi:MAG: hypothetical protein HY403_10780 [Elusimicrobia bacterium]|nr:hypothetical protein [Elusimicrobiota bacterium]